MNLYLPLPVVVGTVPLRAPPYSPFDPLSVNMEFPAMYQPPPVVEGNLQICQIKKKTNWESPEYFFHLYTYSVC